MKWRLVDRMESKCPHCGGILRFKGKYGVYVDIGVELFVYLMGFFVGLCVGVRV